MRCLGFKRTEGFPTWVKINMRTSFLHNESIWNEGIKCQRCCVWLSRSPHGFRTKMWPELFQLAAIAKKQNPIDLGWYWSGLTLMGALMQLVSKWSTANSAPKTFFFSPRATGDDLRAVLCCVHYRWMCLCKHNACVCTCVSVCVCALQMKLITQPVNREKKICDTVTVLSHLSRISRFPPLKNTTNLSKNKINLIVK